MPSHTLARRNTIAGRYVECATCRTPIPADSPGSGFCSNYCRNSPQASMMAASRAQLVPYGGPGPMNSASGVHLPPLNPYAASRGMAGTRDDLALLAPRNPHMGHPPLAAMSHVGHSPMSMAGPGAMSMMGPGAMSMAGPGAMAMMGPGAMSMMGPGGMSMAGPVLPPVLPPPPRPARVNVHPNSVLSDGYAGHRVFSQSRSTCERSAISSLPNAELEVCIECNGYHPKGEHPSRAGGMIDSIAGSMKKFYGAVTNNSTLVLEGLDEQSRGERRKKHADTIRNVERERNRTERNMRRAELHATRQIKRVARQEASMVMQGQVGAASRYL
ncbi:hypothetical protein IWQ60_000143 [Tieghemiomyces parasiticus]|uniref:Uncharacterized protein n=1 Tax=Tieghemiomyces parasiticus TaxID=78921 RepID=A0A9W8E324_9FUNG|nr:hypothetical protein IWQ60_000143 [Tieghemiomyces parasiticus]